MDKEIYEYCKKRLDQFYGENLDMIQYLINNGNREYINIEIKNNLVDYESKNDNNPHIKCYIKFDLGEEKYVINVDNTVSTGIILQDEFVLSSQKYSKSIEQYKNMLFAICEVLSNSILTRNKELKTIR